MESARIRLLQAIYEKLPLICAVAAGSAYLAYYLYVVVKKPSIACRDKSLMKLIDQHCPISKEFYRPTWWCFQSHAQTLLRSLIQSYPVTDYRSEMLRMPDGGKVKLDWADNKANSASPPESCPTVLLLPGLTGCSTDNYVLHMVQTIIHLGYRCVVFNNRGCGGTELWTARTYCAANTDDLEFVVKHVRKLLPQAPVMGIGVSLGAGILFNYMCKRGRDVGLCAGMCVSVVWDLVESATSLEKPLNWFFFNKYLARMLVNKIETQSHMFKDKYDIEHILKSRSIREFDERFTAKQFGYKSGEHYYIDASIHNKIHSLRIPVLTLNAADDPFSPLHAIPVKEAYENDHIAMVITQHGGHIGFVEGIYPGGQTYMNRWVSQFVDAVFKHGLKQN